MKFGFILKFVLIIQLGYAQLASTFEEANHAYANQDYASALQLYTSIEDSQNPLVYYNLGNTYYRLQDFAHAILYYEKSLKWGGPVQDIQYNLIKCRRFLKDELKAPAELVVFKQWKQLAAQKMASFWAISGLVLLWLSVMILLATGRWQLHGYWLYTAFIAALISVILYLLAFTKHRMEHGSSFGILTDSSVAVKSAPSAEATDLFIIHEGIKLGIEKEKENWYQVSLPDGKKGWIAKNTLSQI